MGPPSGYQNRGLHTAGKDVIVESQAKNGGLDSDGKDVIVESPRVLYLRAVTNAQ